MKERPILFSGPMVRAILDDNKTQTRRVVKPQPASPGALYREPDGSLMKDLRGRAFYTWPSGHPDADGRHPEYAAHCPYGVPGDRLWVRETWEGVFRHDIGDCSYAVSSGGTPANMRTQDRCLYLFYKADELVHGEPYAGRWMPSIHMPRWASRLTLEVVDVRVERVHDISPDDALAEGVVETEWFAGDEASALGVFRSLWDSINAARGFGWDCNPWVWVVTFKRVEVQAQ